MIKSLNRAVFLIGAYALLGPVGCGAPSQGEATEPRQTQQALVFGPDFLVREVSAPPSSYQGGPLPVTVTVCNQGTDADSANLEVFLSPDGVMSVDDSLLFSGFVSWLPGGECETNTFYTSPSVPQGAWYVGAIADTYNSSAESDETNNSRTGPLLGIGSGADLFIPSVTVPASVTPGGLFTATVRVCNQGTLNGSAQVQLVLSEDATIHFSYAGPPEEQDLPVFSFYSGPLDAGQCRQEQLQFNLSTPHEGAWYLGAVADPGNSLPELIESNNTRASELFGAGTQPDFLIQAVSGPPSARPGQSFMASVTVCNQGTVGGSTQVQLVLSQDTTIHFSYSEPPEGQDQPLSSFPTGPLAAGQCKAQQVQVSAWAPEQGPWYLGAVADPGNSAPELIETNNTLASKVMGIGDGPDFFIQAVSVPPSAMPGWPFTASVTVCNQGTLGGSTDVQLVLSQDTTIRFSYNEPPQGQDQPLSAFPTGPLAPGQCKTQQVQSYAQPPRYGAYYLGAVADPGSSSLELIEANNTRASELFGVGNWPDFIVQQVSGPASVRPGDPFTVKVTLCNQGTLGGSTTAQLVLSEDTDIRFSYDGPPSAQDYPLEPLSSGHLEPGQCRTQQVQAYAWLPHEGAWYVGVVADPGRSVQELIETNNTRASTLIGFGNLPDLVIQSLSGPASVTPGQPFTASVTVCNQGTTSGPVNVMMVLSEDTDIRFSFSAPPESQDLPVGPLYVPGWLEPGQCKTASTELNGWVPHEGAWYLGAVADPGNSVQELLETNNTRASEELGIGYAADYRIQAVSVPPSAMPGQPFTASVTVCNQGTSGGGTAVQLVLSEDTDIRFSFDSPSYAQDLPLTSFSTGWLEPGQCKTQQVQTSAWAPYEGVWYVGAVADPGNYELELIETNNTRASAPMGVGARSDLVLQAVSGPVSITPNQTFTASVTVCNQGTMSAPAEVQLVLSEDADIRFSFQTPPGSQDYPITSVYFPGGLEPGQCRTQQVQTSAWAPHDGAWYLGAVADPGNYESEFLENNNTLASKPVGFGYRSDFIIEAVSGPASIRPGDPFTASVTVCNQGTQDGSTDVQLVLSEDTTIRYSYNAPPYDKDYPLSSFPTGPLAPGQCMTQQVQTSAWAPHDGAWYLGAVADPGDFALELIETNNTRASTLIGIGYAADLVIRELTGPASVTIGQSYGVTVKVCNEGTVSSSADVQLVLSEDADIRFSYDAPPGAQDWPVEYLSFSNLAPGQCIEQGVALSMPPPSPGSWYVGAVADPGRSLPEFIETNNTRASGAISFQP